MGEIIVYHRAMTKEKSFKELEVELGRVMQRVEESNYDELDELLADYEQGKKLIAQLEKRLETAKNSIKKVK